MRSPFALPLAAALLLSLGLALAPTAVADCQPSLTAAMSSALPGQVPAPLFLTTCQPGDNIAYGEGASGSAACAAATNAANADCQGLTGQSCCNIHGCTCVNGAGGFACTIHYQYMRFMN